MKRLLCGMFVFLSAVCLFAGGTKEKWYSDYDEAVKAAERTDRNIFLLISADSEDERSALLKKDIFNQKTFINGVKDTYVLLNLDFSSMQDTLPEDADEKQQDAFLKTQEKLMKDYEAVSQYPVMDFPSVFLITKEGYVIAAVPDDPAIATPEDYVSFIAGYDSAAQTVNRLVNDLAGASGLERVRIIDELFEATEPAVKHLLAEFIREIPELDPENTTGLLGKYIVQNGYLDAAELFRAMDMQGGIQHLLAVAGHPALSGAERQELYYTAASVSWQFAGPETAITYLQKAYDAAPESEAAESILLLIEELGSAAAQEAGGTEEDAAQ